MLRPRCRPVTKCFFLWLLFSLVANFTWAQSETATVSGQVVDPSGLNITGAQVKLVDIDRDTSSSVNTNNTGLYTFPSVKPGRYRMEVIAAGFKVVNVTGVTVNVQDHLEQNFKLVIGSISESITVEGGAPLVDTESATVSTVVDRNFAENLPMNGRSFQTLIQLTPGVVLTPSSPSDSGQFSVNGERPSSNYWMVDGVSANVGIGANSSGTGAAGNGLGGTLGSFSVLGGTNSLVSVDAMQEFRIQTSTFAPEFGRTPGAQISIVTRSGTNQFHGTIFDYLRNDALDASDWFNGYTNNPPLPKSEERQNDFGGTISGPIIKNRTFFFISYEGLRLRVPQTALTTVPDLAARQDAIPAVQAFLSAYPFDPEQPDLGNGIAQFNASFSNPASLDAYGIRIDHKVSDSLSLFGRYNYSPSQLSERGNGGSVALSDLLVNRITTQTLTLGTTLEKSPVSVNDLRFNYSRANAFSDSQLDNFGGAVPVAAAPFPSPYSLQNGAIVFFPFSLLSGNLTLGDPGRDLQRQINIIDSLSIQKNAHSLKLGIDFRRLSPVDQPSAYFQTNFFENVPSAETGSLLATEVGSNIPTTFLFRNLSLYAQDAWRVFPNLTITYGIRWDVDFVPHSLSGPSFPSVTGFDPTDLSQLALAPNGIPAYKTAYNNFAPRLGAALRLGQTDKWQTVFRGGIGLFTDLVSSEAGNLLVGSYPFGAATVSVGGAFPLNSAAAAPPAITPASLASPLSEPLGVFNPNLQLPHVLQWNAAIEQALGRGQSLSVSYIGAAGRRLLQTGLVSAPNVNFSSVEFVTNAGTSDYDAAQIQFQRRLSRGLQVLASYTWSHSIDTGSAGSIGVLSNALVPTLNPNENRGSSDFDIRNAFSVALTYEIMPPKTDGFAKTVLRGWSTDSVIQARSAPPLNVYDAEVPFVDNASVAVRPDIVAGQSFYVYGATYPGGKTINANAFTAPPVDTQGNLGRNALRSFTAVQWDFALHRDFPIHESLKLQFRTEMFNILNHPNFGPPSGALGQGGFGLASETLAQSLNSGNLGGGGFSALYQIGGPRSIQFALKLFF
jgi:hypothetical protein